MKRTAAILALIVFCAGLASSQGARGAIEEDLIKENWISALDNGNIWVESSPQNPVPHFVLASVYYFNGEYDKQAIEFDLALKNKKNWKKIYGWCEEFNASYPGQKMPQMLLGFISSLMGNDDESLDRYRNVIAMDGKNIFAYMNLGIVHTTKKEYDKAVECFLKAIEIKPDYAQAYFRLGNVYFCLKNYNKAIEYYEKAIENNSTFAEFYFNLAVSYYYAGNEGMMLANAQKAVKLNPKGSIGSRAKDMLADIERDWQKQVK